MINVHWVTQRAPNKHRANADQHSIRKTDAINPDGHDRSMGARSACEFPGRRRSA
jgi:hypothetical protein